MKRLALIAALLLAASPVQAQVATSNGQQLLGGQVGQPAPSQAPTTGVICEEEMTATFCNVPSSPNTAGYGSSGATGSSGSDGRNTSRPYLTTVALRVAAVRCIGARLPVSPLGSAACCTHFRF
jgi:hypothetical protein